MKTEREMFLEWFESSQINCKISDLDLTNHDNYWGNALEFAWHAWQAATQREGFKFVPVEPTQDMLDVALYRQWDDLSSPFENMDRLKYKAMIGVCDG